VVAEQGGVDVNICSTIAGKVRATAVSQGVGQAGNAEVTVVVVSDADAGSSIHTAVDGKVRQTEKLLVVVGVHGFNSLAGERQGVCETLCALKDGLHSITHNHGKLNSFGVVARAVRYVVAHHELATHIPVHGTVVTSFVGHLIGDYLLRELVRKGSDCQP
jgi:hypothetical protein